MTENNSRPFAVFDIDGTLSDCGHRLHFINSKPGKRKDWDGFFAGVGGDSTLAAGVSLCRALIIDGWRIEFWTGRPERTRTDTVLWLLNNVDGRPAGPPLRMRPDGDHRPDHHLKVEWYEALSPEKRPLIIFEYRQGVVDALREAGATVYQVQGKDY